MRKITAQISSKRIVAESTYEVTFDLGLESFDFASGQQVQVILPEVICPDKNENFCTYFIVSTPKNTKLISITLRESENLFVKTLLKSPIGTEVILSGPTGSFMLPGRINKPIVFVTGGIGIAPFISMINSVIETASTNQSMTLLYANSRPERAAYASDLKELAKHNSNLQLYLKTGYIDIDFIKKSVSEIHGKLWFVSGPPVLIYSVSYLLKELGVNEDDIFLEETVGATESNLRKLSPIASKDRLKVSEDIETLLLQDGSIMASQILDVLSHSTLVSVTNLEGTIVYVNDYFNEISGYSDEEIIGQFHSIVKSGHHTLDFYEDMWKTIKSGKIWRGEIKNKSSDGSSYWVDSSISPVFGKDMQISYFIAVGLLITDKKNAEEELRFRKEILESTVRKMQGRELDLENIKKATLNILEDLDEEKRAVEKRVEERTRDIEREKFKLLQVTGNVKGGAVLLDERGEVVFVNEKFYELLSVSQINTRNSSILRVIEDYFTETEIKDFIKKCLAGETFSVPEIEHGEKIYEIYFHCLRSKNDPAHVDGFFILIYNITDAKLLERSKSELVAVASHQLRTPLTAMRGNIEMLIDESYGSMNTEQHELLSDVNLSTARLISMVNDMLDITKIERGSLDMVLELLNVREVLDSIVSDLADYTKRRGVTLTIEVPDELIIYGDKSRVRQVLQNLIDNAVKYSKNPGTLDIYSNSVGEFAQIVLKDNGLGIPKLEQSKIFGRFYRASNTTNSSSSGSGLGLYIVRSIVSQLGGDIWFESEEGIGTTFYVTLPTKKIMVKDKINEK